MHLQRERTFILTLLLVLAAASWAILIWQSRTAQGMGGGLTMGMGAALFLAIWGVMMVAMMFPSATPVILAVARVKRNTGTFRYVFAPTWVFVGAYLLIWTLFGGLSYLGALAASELAKQVPWIMINAARIGGGILMLAGIYQLTSIKRVCLAKCRAPENFILHSWGKEYSGSLRMGLKYGIYCLGSYWLLFVLLFPWE
jgi:predicted metal-binding membrane protein